MCLTFFGTVVFLHVLFHALFPETIQPVASLLVGNSLVVGFFVVPDSRIAPRTRAGRWWIGLLIGIVAFVIRGFSSFPEGVLFAVLFGNVFSAIVDEGILKQRYKGITA
jgi:Na+-translocating ferredoxin:NAD+ oxidoreductase RnfD subunit